MFFTRDKCLLCLDKNLIPFLTLPQFPIKCIDDGFHTDISWNLILGRCESCASVQHMNLLDPSILYGGKYPLDNTHSAIWNKHHDDFSNFIKAHTSPSSHLLEIGGSSQVLLQRLFSSFPSYTIFDFSLDTVSKRNDVKYIAGNCETYEFSKDSVLIMSHVFEHLYDPNIFLQNCSKNQVQSILISIPSMQNNDAVHVTREHTYLYNHDDILYLFSKYGYSAAATEFSGFSIFYSFNYNPSTSTLPRTIEPLRYLKTQDYFTKQFSVPPNSFLIGAGFWSQLLFANIKNKENVIGVLDNDRTKQNFYLSNTNLLIQPFHALKDLPSNHHVLILEKKLWTDEVVSLIQSINPSISIVYLS